MGYALAAVGLTLLGMVLLMVAVHCFFTFLLWYEDALRNRKLVRLYLADFFATIIVAALLVLISILSIIGACVATAWVSCGLWMVIRTKNRGLLADASFVFTWPLYLALGR